MEQENICTNKIGLLDTLSCEYKIPKGRLSRLQFFVRWLFSIIVVSVILITFKGVSESNFSPIFFVYFLCGTIKRCHDLNFSGWFSLLLFIPLINLIFILYLFFAKGINDKNKYGEKPIPDEMIGSWAITFAIIAFVLVCIRFNNIIN